jgi:RHS repeat-associated protein
VFKSYRAAATALFATLLLNAVGAPEGNTLNVPKQNVVPGKAKITISWNPIPGNGTWYKLDRYNDTSSQSTIMPPSPNTSFDDTNVQNGQTNNYKIFAFETQDPHRSSETLWFTGTTNLNAPNYVSVLEVTPNNFIAHWTAVADADDYVVQIGVGTPNSTIGSTTGTSLALGIYQPQDQNRTIRVFSRNAAGYSPESGWVHFNGPYAYTPDTFIPQSAPVPGQPKQQDHPQPGPEKLKPLFGALPIPDKFRPLVNALPFGPLVTGDPTNLASGQTRFNPAPDLVTYNPNGVPATFQIAYSSAQVQNRDMHSPGLSEGWAHNYDATALTSLTADTWQPVIIRYSQGGRIAFTPILSGGTPTGQFHYVTGTPLKLTGTPGTTPNSWTNLTLLNDDGVTWHFTPTHSGIQTLSAIKNPLGQGITLSYNTDRSLHQVRDLTSHILLQECAYSGGRLDSVTDAYGKRIYYTFGSGFGAALPGSYLIGRSQVVNSTTAKNAAQTQFSWAYQIHNGVGPLLNTINCHWPTTTKTGQIHWTIHPGTGKSVVDKTVDGNGHINQFTYQTGQTLVQVKSSTGTVISSYTQKFDSAFRQTALVDSGGYESTLVYGDPNNPNQPTAQIDQVGRVTTTTYDQFGHVTSISEPGRPTKSITYSYANFPLGRIIARLAAGLTLVSTAYYEPSGLPQSVTVPSPSGSGTVATTYTYDSLGNILTKTNPGLTPGSTITQTYNYAADGSFSQPAKAGQPLLYTNGEGETHHFRYNTNGLLSQSWDHLGNTNSYTYNVADQQLTASLPAPNLTTPATTLINNYAFPGGPVTSSGQLYGLDLVPHLSSTYEYGGEGELLKVTTGSEFRQTILDASYRPIASIDQSGRTTSTTYNSRGLVASVTEPDGQITQYVNYNATGLPTQVTLPGGITQNLAYDSVTDDLLTVSYPAHPTLNQTNTYNSSGDLLSESNAEATITRTYGDVAQVLTETTTYTGVPAKTITYTYAPNGAVTGIATPAGNITTGYDLAGRITSVRNPYNETTTYTYLDNGWLHQTITQNGNKAINTLDALGRITKVENRRSNNTLISSYTTGGFTPGGDPTSVTASVSGYAAHTGSLTWQYDSSARISQEVGTIIGGFTANYTHDLAGNPTQFANQLRNYNVHGQRTNAGFTYLPNGTPSTHNGVAITSNAIQNITGVGTLTHGYRPDQLRAWKKPGTAAKRYYLYIGGAPIIELSPSGAVQAYNSFGPTGFISRRVGTTSTFYSFDHRGGTVQRTNSTGAVISRHAYSAYGTPNNSATASDPWINFKAQHGYYTDWENGLIRCDYRFYDPGQGTWLGQDPIGWLGGSNLYQYCGGNPISAIDPSGLVRDALYQFSDASAGFGDAESWGASAFIRSFTPGADVVDPTSAAYKYGGAASDAAGFFTGKSEAKAAAVAALLLKEYLANLGKKGVKEVVQSTSEKVIKTAGEKAGIYVLRDRNGIVRYVGQTNNFDRRFAEHLLKYPELTGHIYKDNIKNAKQRLYWEQVVVDLHGGKDKLLNSRNPIAKGGVNWNGYQKFLAGLGQ